MLSADPMVSLSACFADIPDPRRGQGRRHPLPTVLAIAAGAILCGMRGYQAISRWAQDLSQQARARFRCRYRERRYQVPCRTVIREVLVRVDPDALSAALQRWNLQYADDEALAIDGKTLCHAIDDDGRQTHVLGVVGHHSHTGYTQKKVGALPVADRDEVKQTHEIGMVIPVLEALDLTGKTLTTDALLTPRTRAAYRLEHDAHDVFTVKDNQPTLLADIRLIFAGRAQPACREPLTLAHGRIEQRAIWTTTRLNAYLNFPGVGQAFVIERHTVAKKTGKTSTETVYGLTDHPPDRANAPATLACNRGHWTIENSCHDILDWNWDEDRCTLRTGHGPANLTALRRFAIGAIKAKSRDTVAATLQRLARAYCTPRWAPIPRQAGQ
jgi:predicted transposase YbfD/YdcC